MKMMYENRKQITKNKYLPQIEYEYIRSGRVKIAGPTVIIIIKRVRTARRRSRLVWYSLIIPSSECRDVETG